MQGTGGFAYILHKASPPVGHHLTPLMATHPTHPALDEFHALSPNIYPCLFDWIFESDEFVHWCDGRHKWRRLHCTGGAGSGKSTFSALAVRRLHDGFPQIPVVKLFISADVHHNDAAFVEDFLATICRQLGEDDELDACIERGHGKRAAVRIHLVRELLHKRLLSRKRAFLVLDGIDGCSTALEMLLNAELTSF